MARAPATTEIEVLPEADRLEGTPHPRETQNLYGHEEAERAMAEALNSGRLHHSWLLSGQQGIGKATLAYRFARAALAEPGERQTAAGRLDVSDDTQAAHHVRALSHPNLLVIRRPFDPKAKRFTTTIPIDEVRRLRSFLAHRSGGTGWRIVIVDQADELNVNAANALLKSLEEPPPRTVFLLISSAPGRLLATIRSRCRVLPMHHLSDADLRKAVEQAVAACGQDGPDSADWPLLQRLAEGSVRRLLALWGGGGLDLHKRIARVVGDLPKLDWRQVHALADELQPNTAQQQFELFFELLLDQLARLIKAQALGGGTPEEQSLAARVIGEDRLASFAGLWERLARDKATTTALNLDRKTLILETVGALASASQQQKSA